jgi:hypothetical protein
VATDAFGVVAMVAMTPLIAIQILGLVYKIKQGKSSVQIAEAVTEAEQIDVIELDSSVSSEETADSFDDIIDF